MGQKLARYALRSQSAFRDLHLALFLESAKFNKSHTIRSLQELLASAGGHRIRNRSFCTELNSVIVQSGMQVLR